jgi:PAS domain S-box-containing protein
MMGSFLNWVRSSLSRQLFFALGATLTLLSLAFLALFVGYYRGRLVDERARTSAEINDMLQVALENAMLKRDIEGLQEIVAGLGRRKSIKDVMILNTKGEVRFASDRDQLGRVYDLTADNFCPGCDMTKGGTRASTFVGDPGQGGVLRSVNAVANRAACRQCHGETSVKPVNGILVVDYDAGEIKQEATKMGLAMTGAGVLVLLAGTAAIGWVLQRSVIGPVHKLQSASAALADGRFDTDVEISGRDELAQLGRMFRSASQQLESQQKELAAREKFLQSLIDAVPDGIRVIGPDYRVLKVNRAFCQQMELDRDAVLTSPCYVSSHQRNEPCAPTLVTCPLHEIGRSGRPVTCRHTHKRADGAEVIVEVSAAPLEIVENGRRQLVVVEAIRDLSSDLHHSQEQRLSEIGQLAAGVAHEIRNPLSSIHLTLQALRNKPLDENKDRLVDHFDLMDGEIDRCIQVTNRLLRLSSPPSELPELVAIDEVIPEVVSLLNAEALHSGSEIALDLAPSLRVIATDSDIRMLVLNIAQNAFHAMPNGGRLTITGRCEGANVVIAFKDTGCGIARNDMLRIFQPFWSRRADGAHGTGLGLPICREIVRRHNGTITVTSEPDAGSQFVVTLPWAEASIEET